LRIRYVSQSVHAEHINAPLLHVGDFGENSEGVPPIQGDSHFHSWSIDDRTSKRRQLAEIVFTQHEYMTNMGLLEGDSILHQALKGGE